ncbi:MAG: DsbA family oxidoreductase [Rhodospirillaceae bacterium]
MPKSMQIDFVSDVVCPWCVVGLRELERALVKLSGTVAPKIELQPFELNPTLPAKGQSMAELYAEKFGQPYEQLADRREAVKARASAVGFDIAMTAESRIYNTFDAHRLLHWAGLEGRQIPLKHALFTAHFTDGRSIGDHEVLVSLAEEVGLDGAKAREILTSGLYRQEVQAAERNWQAAGINSVPAVVINRKHLISGGQTAAVFEQALRQIAAEA